MEIAAQYGQKQLKPIRCLVKFLVIVFVVFMDVNTVKAEKKVFSEVSKNEKIKRLLNHANTCFKRQQYTNPKGANAYEFCQKVLSLDSSNKYALKKIRDILETLLNLLKQETIEYGKLLKAETEGKHIKTEMVLILTNIINLLKDCKRICEEYPQKDSETTQMIKIFKDNIRKYNKLRSYYHQKP